MPALVTIVELPSFVRDTEGALEESQIEEIKVVLAANPEAGAVIPGTGGVRKLRWAASGRGKRGGGRVIYYFHSAAMPLFLIAFFTKNVRSDLSQREKSAARALVDRLTKDSLP